MKRRLLSALGSCLLLVVIIFAVYRMFPLYLYTVWPATSQFFKNSRFSQSLTQTLEPIIPQTTPLGLFEKINQYRQNQNLPLFKQDPDICTAVNPVGNQPTTGSADTVFGVCPLCSSASIITISKYATTNMLLARLLEEPVTQKTLNDNRLTQLCINDHDGTLALLFARRKDSAAPTSTKKVVTTQKIIPIPTAAPTAFSEDQLWQALAVYRQAQKRTILARDEKFCAYARKRVEDQITMMSTTAPAAYPNPDKYPLDAHRSFASDAESGYAFDVTGAGHLAENLAYYPNAQSATHIIEWGWDSSTEGHREAQLSNDWTKACISGKAGFYVAIFGN